MAETGASHPGFFSHTKGKLEIVGLGSRISRGVAVSLALATVFFGLLVSACSPEASQPADNSEASRPADNQGASRPADNQEASRPTDNQEASRLADASRFSAQVDHPLVPLASVPVTIFEGTERGFFTRSEVRVESRVLERTARVAEVPVAVVDVKEYKDGQLIEHTLDYYAQDKEGNVWYLGERVDDIADGKVVAHSGEWLAGRGDARPGLFMPAHPKVGQTFQQERAPGIAEDRSTVVAVGLEVRTPLKTFPDCIKTKDIAPLDNVTEFKHYCPGVGLVREEGVGERLDLVQYR